MFFILEQAERGSGAGGWWQCAAETSSDVHQFYGVGAVSSTPAEHQLCSYSMLTYIHIVMNTKNSEKEPTMIGSGEKM